MNDDCLRPVRGLRSLKGRRVLFLNWRDGAHPQAGGAEAWFWETARRFAAGGALVTAFSSLPSGAPPRDRLDGVDVIRGGRRFSVYARAAHYLLRHRDDFDAVVDFQNGLPFFAPLFVARDTAVVCVVFHVHQHQFTIHFPWPMSTVGRLLEGPVSRLVYRSHPTVVISPSTRAAVRRELGFRGPVYIVPTGVYPLDVGWSRSHSPRIVVVNRIVAHKRIDRLIKAVPTLLAAWPDLHVDIAGDGPNRSALERLAAALGVADHVCLHGRVTDAERNELLAHAWISVNPSVGEGWGISVIEANAVGVPTLAYDVPGLRDSIRPGVTGWLVEEGSDLAPEVHEALTLLSDPSQATAIARQCRLWAGRFSWDETAERLASVVSTGLTTVPNQRVFHQRRRNSDLACVARFARRDWQLSGSPTIALRSTDLVRIDQDEVTMLLHAADEQDGLAVLRRLGITGGVDLRLARDSDLLAGIPSDPFPGPRNGAMADKTPTLR